MPSTGNTKLNIATAAINADVELGLRRRAAPCALSAPEAAANWTKSWLTSSSCITDKQHAYSN